MLLRHGVKNAELCDLMANQAEEEGLGGRFDAVDVDYVIAEAFFGQDVRDIGELASAKKNRLAASYPMAKGPNWPDRGRRGGRCSVDRSQ